MKILTFKQFLELPAGTVFSTYRPVEFGDLRIKSSTCEGNNDFLYQQLAFTGADNDTRHFVDQLDDAQANGTSLPIDLDSLEREGLYDPQAYYAVWEPVDVEKLIARLQLAFSEANSINTAGSHQAK